MDYEMYLGDAVYASFDGWQIKLRTGDGNHQVIYLEPGVYAALTRYVASVQRPAPTEENKEAANV